MRLVTSAQMRELDRRTIEEAGIPGSELMDRAGRGVADVAAYMADLAGFHHPSAILFAGRGNNGGDAFAAARHLKDFGFDVSVWLAGREAQVQGDALKHLNLMKAEEIEVEEFTTREEWENNLAYPASADFLIDGLLGTGSHGPARGPVAWAIQYINSAANDAFVISIDIPSGINADTGVAEGDAVYADVTVTLGYPKTGLVAPASLEFVGCVEVIDIGLVPLPPLTRSGAEVELVYSTELRKLLPRRARGSHKGTYGHVLLIGGARGYAGAIALAARAAGRAGIGLTTALVPAGVQPIVAGAALETMVFGGPETETGSLAASALDPWRARLDSFDAVLIGPGLTPHPDSRKLVLSLLERVRGALVLDADALNVLAGDAARLANARGAVIVTPHPGEMARLLGMEIAQIQSDRASAARMCVEKTGAIVILKGAGTVIAASQRPVFINMTGNPGMATGGSGDVLAGIVTGLVGQGVAPFDATRAAVFLHGRAGDMAAWRSSQTGMIASDIVKEIPFAFRELTLR